MQHAKEEEKMTKNSETLTLAEKERGATPVPSPRGEKKEDLQRECVSQRNKPPRHPLFFSSSALLDFRTL